MIEVECCYKGIPKGIPFYFYSKKILDGCMNQVARFIFFALYT